MADAKGYMLATKRPEDHDDWFDPEGKTYVEPGSLGRAAKALAGNSDQDVYIVMVYDDGSAVTRGRVTAPEGEWVRLDGRIVDSLQQMLTE